jgi:glucose-1-phosphate thymidylyltransferase
MSARNRPAGHTAAYQLARDESRRSMKGIILAGGAGTRLHPLTRVVSKQLMPIYDKPMIYYPLSTLMLAGIREVLIISTPTDLPAFRRLFGTGESIGISLSYAEQPTPAGLAQAFTIGREFIDGEPCCMILGDNIFHGHGMTEITRRATALRAGGLIFAYYVRDPQRYGVIEFDASGRAISLEEKPAQPKSKYAVPGMYFYGPEVCDEAARLKPGRRGELEITDLNSVFLARSELQVEKLGRGIAWLDTGTHQSLMEAGAFIQAIEERQGLKVACLEEIAWRNGWIGRDAVAAAATSMGKSGYADYLRELLCQEGFG